MPVWYAGALKPARWSWRRLDETDMKCLRAAAANDCRFCEGRGWTGKPRRAQLCVCVNRRKAR